jgi:hypothetical protein
MVRADLAVIAANPYWSEDEARVALAEWHRSGLSLPAFAVANGLHVGRLRRWRQRLSKVRGEVAVNEAESPRPTITFVPVAVTSSATGATVVRVIAGDIAVEVIGATPAWVAALVNELGRTA